MIILDSVPEILEYVRDYMLDVDYSVEIPVSETDFYICNCLIKLRNHNRYNFKEFTKFSLLVDKARNYLRQCKPSDDMYLEFYEHKWFTPVGSCWWVYDTTSIKYSGLWSLKREVLVEKKRFLTKIIEDYDKN
jgi:hypothetical protein